MTSIKITPIMIAGTSKHLSSLASVLLLICYRHSFFFSLYDLQFKFSCFVDICAQRHTSFNSSSTIEDSSYANLQGSSISLTKELGNTKHKFWKEKGSNRKHLKTMLTKNWTLPLNICMYMWFIIIERQTAYVFCNLNTNYLGRKVEVYYFRYENINVLGHSCVGSLYV